jgi:PEP-CTERM motif
MIGKYAGSNHNGCSYSGLKNGLVSIWITLFVLLMLSVPSVLAQTNVDFQCSLSPTSHCTGSVAASGSNFSSTGIQVFNDSGPYNASVPFMLAWNTATGTISIDGTGLYAGQNLIGTILSFSAMSLGSTSNDYTFVVKWPTLPAMVQAQLGTLTGVDSGFAIALKSGTSQSVDVLITPTPEPASMLIFGTGLLAIGLVIRKRAAGKAAARLA